MTNCFKINRWKVVFTSILILGITARFIGLTTFLQMDEKTVLDNIIHFASEHTLMPQHYYYPTFYSYLTAIPFYLIAIIYDLLGIISTPAHIIPLFKLNPAIVIIFPRILTVLFAVSTFLLLHWIGEKWFSSFTGIIASLCLVLSATHLKYSAYVKPDIAQVFFATCVIYFCLLILENSRWKNYVGAGIFSGLVIACKYNGAGIFIAPVIAHLLSIKKHYHNPSFRNWFNSRIVGTLLLIPVVFFITSPGWLMNPSNYIAALREDMSVLAGNDAPVGGIRYIQPLLYLMQSDTTLVPVFIIAVFWGLYRRRRKDLLLLGMILPTFLLIGGLEKKYISHYLMFIFPAAGLLVGEMFHSAFQHLEKRSFILMKTGILMLVFTCPLYSTISYGVNHIKPDNRYSAANWIYRSIPEGKRIVMDALTPYVYGGYCPPLFSKDQIDYYLQTWQRPVGIKYLAGMPYYEKIDMVYSNDWVSDVDAEYMITSSYCYENFFNLVAPRPNQKSYKMFISNKNFYKTLLFTPETIGWQRIKTFDSSQGPAIVIFKKI